MQRSALLSLSLMSLLPSLSLMSLRFFVCCPCFLGVHVVLAVCGVCQFFPCQVLTHDWLAGSGSESADSTGGDSSEPAPQLTFEINRPTILRILAELGDQSPARVSGR